MKKSTLATLGLMGLAAMGCKAKAAAAPGIYIHPVPTIPQCIPQSLVLTPSTNGLGVTTTATFVAPSDAPATFKFTYCCARLGVLLEKDTTCTATGYTNLSTAVTVPQNTWRDVTRTLTLPWKNVDMVRKIAHLSPLPYNGVQCTVVTAINNTTYPCTYASSAAFISAQLPATLNESGASPCCSLPLLDANPIAEVGSEPPWWMTGILPPAPPSAGALSALDEHAR